MSQKFQNLKNLKYFFMILNFFPDFLAKWQKRAAQDAFGVERFLSETYLMIISRAELQQYPKRKSFVAFYRKISVDKTVISVSLFDV